jgi:subtilisin family serine protease
MIRDPLKWPAKAAAALTALLPLACLDGSDVHAQSIMRSPNINIESRLPTINPTIAPRINPNIAERSSLAVGTAARPPLPRIGVTSSTARAGELSGLSYPRYSHNLYPSCADAYRGSDGECFDRPVASTDGGGGSQGKKGKNGKNGGLSGNTAQSAINLRAVPSELVAEIDGALTDAQADELARRHGLVRIRSQNFPLLGATIGLFRIADRRPTETVRRELETDVGIRYVQFNFRYLLQDQTSASIEGDPAQYALAQLRLPQAHKLAHGMNVTVAVIDSGIDASHPELVNSIADSCDALGSKEGPHVHGTGIAGAIAAHARLMGSAPEARILAIRAFGAAARGSESTTFVILRSLDYAALHGAQIINMSFAGPKDMLIDRGVAAAAARGIVLVAAAGNGGAKSPPLYPAANPNVIAVSGTDAQDRLFAASNRGTHIALAAPGSDIFLPAPDGKYQITSGTSFSAAYVSGIAALVLERNPALKPNEVRAILTGTARDLGAPGRDDLFGAGEADAFAAVTSVTAPAAPAAAAKVVPAAGQGPGRNNASVRRGLDEPPPAMASDNSVAIDGNGTAAR